MGQFYIQRTQIGNRISALIFLETKVAALDFLGQPQFWQCCLSGLQDGCPHPESTLRSQQSLCNVLCHPLFADQGKHKTQARCSYPCRQRSLSRAQEKQSHSLYLRVVLNDLTILVSSFFFVVSKMEVLIILTDTYRIPRTDWDKWQKCQIILFYVKGERCRETGLSPYNSSGPELNVCCLYQRVASTLAGNISSGRISILTALKRKGRRKGRRKIQRTHRESQKSKKKRNDLRPFSSVWETSAGPHSPCPR